MSQLERPRYCPRWRLIAPRAIWHGAGFGRRSMLSQHDMVVAGATGVACRRRRLAACGRGAAPPALPGVDPRRARFSRRDEFYFFDCRFVSSELRGGFRFRAAGHASAFGSAAWHPHWVLGVRTAGGILVVSSALVSRPGVGAAVYGRVVTLSWPVPDRRRRRGRGRSLAGCPCVWLFRFLASRFVRCCWRNYCLLSDQRRNLSLRCDLGRVGPGDRCVVAQ